MLRVRELYEVASTSARRNSRFTKHAVLYQVTRHDELPLVANHFDRFPLLAQ